MASAGSSPRRHVPFGGHQLAEYALAAALVVVGMHASGRTEVVLSVSGALLGLLALVSKGPLAAWRIIPRKLHVFLDLLLAACFALSPALYLPSLPLIPIVISEAVAVVLVRMSLTTEIVPRPRPERGAALPSAASGAGLSDGSDAASAAAATAGRLLGTAVAKARQSHAPLVAARGLGRVTGRVRRLGQAVAAAKPPSDTSQPVRVPPGASEPPD
ncbi:MAG: hypothetical protein ABR972_10040 [Acidimicrobiales bacterium]|jgi:hypothetical protein